MSGASFRWVGTRRVALRYVSSSAGSPGGIAPAQPPKNGTCKFPCMPLKPCQRPSRNAVLPRRICAVTPPSPYALGAPAPSSGGRVHQQCRHYRHRLSLLRRLAKLSGDARPDGRRPAFPWGHVARGRNPSPPHDRTAFASSILPCPHVYQLALRRAFPPGRRTGLPCSVSVTTNGGGARYPPVACDAHDKEGENPCTRSSALLAQACQHLWLVVYDD